MTKAIVIQPKQYMSAETINSWRVKLLKQAEEGLVIIPSFFQVIEASGVETIELRTLGED